MSWPRQHNYLGRCPSRPPTSPWAVGGPQRTSPADQRTHRQSTPGGQRLPRQQHCTTNMSQSLAVRGRPVLRRRFPGGDHQQRAWQEARKGGAAQSLLCMRCHTRTQLSTPEALPLTRSPRQAEEEARECTYDPTVQTAQPIPQRLPRPLRPDPDSMVAVMTAACAQDNGMADRRVRHLSRRSAAAGRVAVAALTTV